MNDNVSSEFAVQAVYLLRQANSKLEHCLQQISDDQCWWRPHPTMNSIGNLILHSCGNLKQWAITSILKLEDNRNRESEFTSETKLSKSELLTRALTTTKNAELAIVSLEKNRWLERLSIQGFEVNYLQATLHTCSHYQGHVHQIILLTRLIKGDHYEFHWSPGANNSRKDLPM